jgi:hypothetical protein
VAELLRVLGEVELVRETSGDDAAVAYLPAAIPQHLQLGEILQRLRNHGDAIKLTESVAEVAAVRKVLSALEGCTEEAGGDLSLADLIDDSADAAQASAERS